jgi:hypothetical protein
MELLPQGGVLFLLGRRASFELLRMTLARFFVAILVVVTIATLGAHQALVLGLLVELMDQIAKGFHGVSGAWPLSLPGSAPARNKLNRGDPFLKDVSAFSYEPTKHDGS